MDEIVQKLIRARDNRSVLKTRLLTLDAKLSGEPIFAFEGRDDREAYSAWIRRVDGQLTYEPFECGNKKKTLDLFDLVEVDKSGLKGRVFFFVDRDFDDLQGREVDPSVFLTTRYSVENYLVDTQTLDDILKVELHCHEAPDVRKTVLDLFDTVYSEFLSVTASANERLFIARQLGIKTNPCPNSIQELASVSLGTVTSGSKQPHEIVQYETEPDTEAVKHLIKKFAVLDPKQRYRGKFSFMFFKKWIEILSCERRATCSDLFPDKTAHKIKNEISIGSFAFRSPIPEGLDDFLKLAA
jgi:hypothetical protein